MPQTKRRFADDDPESDEEPVYRGGHGKQLRHMGQQRQQPNDDDEDSDEERPSGGGQQFRGAGGKQLHRFRPNESEDDDDDDDEEEEEEEDVVHHVSRGGGKSLFRPPPQDDDEDDEEDDEEPIQVVPRGGKSLVRMRPPEEEEEDDDDDDDEEEEEEEEEPVQHRGRGKSLMGMQQRGGGKQLRPPVQEEEESDEDDSEFEEEEAPPVVVQRAGGGGTQLRRAAPPKLESEEDDDDFDDAMDIDEESEEEAKKPAVRPAPGREKTLSQPSAEKPKPPPKKATPARAAKKAPEPEDMEVSSSEDERELDMETFDTHELVQGEEDQKYLDSLPELEREAILGERFEKLKSAADMKKALRESKRKEREERKLAQKQSAEQKPARKAPAKKKMDTSGDAALAAMLESKRESFRNRDAAGKKEKKDAARAHLRELKSQQKEEESEEESDLDFGSDVDEDSGSDYEEDTVKLKPWQLKNKAAKTSSRLDRHEQPSASSDEEMEDVSAKAPAVEAELEDYMKVTLPRRRLARWCNEPFFNQSVLGCFVRLFIGESEDRQKCYRLCEIVGVEKSKSEYKFPTTTSHEKPITTSKLLRLKFGKNEKSFPMYLVSDSRPTDEDVRKYVSIQKASRQEVLGRREATRLRKKQDELVNNYTYTQADIEKNVAERRKTGKSLTTLGLEQTRVAIAVQAAQSFLHDAKRRLEDAKRAHLEASDHDSEELKRAIEEAEEAVAEAKVDLEAKKEEEQRILVVVENRKKKLARRQKDKNWAKVNERAAMINQTADFESYKEQQAKKEADAKGGSEPRFNPYARRKVKPKILWEVGQKEEKKDDDATKAVDNEARDDAGTTEMTKDDQAVNDIPQENVLGSQKAAFIGQGHQFSIDDEALAPDPNSILGTNRKKQDGIRVRKGLSLAQYQERKTAGLL